MSARAPVDLTGRVSVGAAAVLRRDVALGAMTTYRVGGAAAWYAAPESVEQLTEIAAAALDEGLAVMVIGKGSNLLVADEGFPGLALNLAALPEEIDIDGVEVVASGGAALPVVARRVSSAGLTGFEWAVGVPGSIGGAVRMNAGGHGSDMAACTLAVELADLRRAKRGWVDASRLGLRFRGSDLADHQIVLRARLGLTRGDAAASEELLAQIVRWRREHQPGGQNCGSVFVNPIPGELAAAELIDRLGLRGLTVGGAQVSPKHANFVQAMPGATAADVRAVIEQVRAAVAEATGITLRSEVRLVGFADEASTESHPATEVVW